MKSSPNFNQKSVNFVSTFDERKIKISEHDLNFQKEKEMLNERLAALKSGNSELISIDDYEKMLEK